MFLKNKEQIDAKSIFKKDVKRKTYINNCTCSFILKDALFANFNNKDVLLDETVIDNMFSEITKVLKKSSTKYNPIPKSIIISHENQLEMNESNNLKEPLNDEILKYIKPRWTLDDVYIEENSKKQIKAALTMAKYKDKLFKEWGLEDSIKNGHSLVLNFYGSPGTGKSMAAEAIASYLNKDVLLVNYSELESKYVGETPKNIMKAFKTAEETDAVLIFDEADSFLGKRLTNINQSADYGVNITRSVMLMEIERFDGIVVFTTNLINNYDEAFKRRILANVEFKIPNEQGRIKIWEKHLPKKLPLNKDINPSYLASLYQGISGADIKDIVLYAAVLCLENEQDYISKEDFDQAYSYIKNRYSNSENFSIKHEVVSKEQYENEIRKLREG